VGRIARPLDRRGEDADNRYYMLDEDELDVSVDMSPAIQGGERYV